MKKYLSIFAMFAVIFATSSLFIACGGDDDVNDGNVDDGNVEVSVVGVWECANVESDTNNPDLVQVGEKVSFKSDGTYSTNLGITGKWKKNGNILTLIQDATDAVAIDYIIEKMTSTEFILSVDLQIGKVKYSFKHIVDNGNDTNATLGLVGRWKVVSDITITDAGKKLIDEPGAIWVFTDKTLTIYDESDLYNKKAVEYTFRDNEIISSGFPKRKVESLTDNQIVLTWKTFANYDQTVTLQRVGSNIQEQQEEQQQEEVPTLIGTWEWVGNSSGSGSNGGGDFTGHELVFTEETFGERDEQKKLLFSVKYIYKNNKIYEIINNKEYYYSYVFTLTSDILRLGSTDMSIRTWKRISK